MPELPDIEVFSGNLKKMLAGEKLTKLKVVNGKKLKDNPAELSKGLEKSVLEDVYRSGKEMRFKFSNGNVLGLHLMLTGDIIPFEKTNERKSTIVELYFGNGKNIALTDRMKNANVKLNPEDKEGVDALSKELNFKYLKKILDKKAAVKNILLDQNLIRGIGNGYSDEILWETRISPFSIGKAIPDEKVRELAKTIKKVLKSAKDKIQRNYPGLVHGEIRDFMKIHTKKKTESPTGFPIKLADRGMLKTFYTDEQVLYE